MNSHSDVIYISHIPRTEPLEYAVFGTIQSEESSEVEMKPLILGSLTADEDTAFIYSPADVPGHRKVHLQDREVSDVFPNLQNLV